MVLQEDYQQMAFARPAPSGGLEYAGIPTTTSSPLANGGPTYMSGALFAQTANVLGAMGSSCMSVF
jgi:hypothetical protein